MATLKNFINGEYVSSASTETLPIVNPATEEVVAVSPKSNQADVDRAYEAAVAAFAVWRRVTPSERQKALLQIADAVEQHAAALVDAQVRNTGQLRRDVMDAEVLVAADQIRFFAGAARVLEGRASTEYMAGHTSTIRREPLGVVAQVAPWNYPFMMAVWKIAPALAAGDTVVLKPSDTTPESTLLFAELCQPYLPKGAFNVLLGDAETGSLIVGDKRAALASITGSVRAGIQVATLAARNLTRAHLELGGKAPVVVFADVADLAAAADSIAKTGLFNAGQDCTAATRVLVEASAHEAFAAALAAAVARHQPGAPEETDAWYGCVNNARQLAHVSSFFERLPPHARVLTGGHRVPRKGFYFEPTLVDGLRQEDELVQNEVFGPVLTLQTFADEADALAKANGVQYGLAASVWTSHHGCAMRMSKNLDFGTVWLNTHIPLVGEMPHGGFKQSGYGKDLSMYALEEYTRVKHVMHNLEE